MTRSFIIIHLKFDKDKNSYRYRRRVPAHLQPTLGKKEFIKALGKTELEAMKNYHAYHEHVEQLLQLGPSSTVDGPNTAALKTHITAQFIDQKADIYSSGAREDEKLSREEKADHILRKYTTDINTGYPHPNDLTPTDAVMITALLEGVSAIKVELSISAAYAFYLNEKQELDPYKRKKQLQRFERSKANLLKITKQDIPITKIDRSHARGLLDTLLKRMSVDSVRRNINDVKAVLSLAIREHDLNTSNPFAKLGYPKPTTAAIDLRHPLPDQIISTMYGELSNNLVLQDIWTLLHHTGAQNAEILELKGKHLILDTDVPHIQIKPDEHRSVKTLSRVRNVPLVGLALLAAKRLNSDHSVEDDLFPKYANTYKHDNFSQTVRNRLRKHTSDIRHTIYSLRHNMKDALRGTKAGERVEQSILGHASERTSAAQYGSAVAIREMQSAMLQIKFATPWALLHKSGEGRSAPYPRRTYPTGSVIGMPRAV